jgi:adenine deaminase
MDGQLITQSFWIRPFVENALICSDVNNDVLKIVVINRYTKAKPSIGFVQGFGLKEGAIASTVAHDSHNIIAVGVDDTSLFQAIDEIVKRKGGIAVAHNNGLFSLPLPIAGLMSNERGEAVAARYEKLNHEVKKLGSTLAAPFMTLSFMALLVIPELKISDKGLFDGISFQMTPLEA